MCIYDKMCTYDKMCNYKTCNYDNMCNAQSSLHKGVRVLNPSKLGFTEHSPTAEI